MKIKRKHDCRHCMSLRRWQPAPPLAHRLSAISAIRTVQPALDRTALVSDVATVHSAWVDADDAAKKAATKPAHHHYH